MGSNGKLLTIKEAAEFTGLKTNTIYKHIKKRKLPSLDVNEQGVAVKKVREADLVRVYGIGVHKRQWASSDVQWTAMDKSMDGNGHPPPSTHITKIEIREVIEEFFEAKQTQLMKPMEEMALYKVGQLENELNHLQAEKANLLQELEQYKALPGPVDKVIEELSSSREAVMEMELKRKAIDEELEQVKIKLQAEEQSKRDLEAQMTEVVDAWKKRVEELEKPWWKKLWGR